MLPAAGAMLRGDGGGSTPTKGAARTSVFGIEGEGFKFVYVFDRSGSMGGTGRNALNASKAELLASLESLGSTHQFQIIFYNEQPTMFPLAGQQGRLVFGEEANKSAAYRFVQSITADGATDHELALRAALRMNPDVIFFLTDADEPSLSPAQLERISRTNAGRSVINSIEFGLGPWLGQDNFLVELARRNGGQHSYVDISRMRREESN
jgi:hypothetical protein